MEVAICIASTQLGAQLGRERWQPPRSILTSVWAVIVVLDTLLALLYTVLIAREPADSGVAVLAGWTSPDSETSPWAPCASTQSGWHLEAIL